MLSITNQFVKGLGERKSRGCKINNVEKRKDGEPRPRMSARLPALFRDDLLIFQGERRLFAESFVTFSLGEVAPARKYSNSFGIFLAYS